MNYKCVFSGWEFIKISFTNRYINGFIFLIKKGENVSWQKIMF